ncbi:MAG TPA: ShlB/FhaC/HecB family hemolysin secretion/activation protein [Gammaproteobacteria bacterium]|nr:ShlB/FhaC/HecB family hemolysin secretion/activation protein [Gammaproteobacteria bacterium]
MRGSVLAFASVAFCMCLPAAELLAAPPPSPTAPTPPPVTPGQVQSSLPTQTTPLPKAQSAPISNAAAVTPSGVAPGGPAVTVQGFDIEGNSAIPASELQAQIAGYVGKSLTLAELYDAADVLTRYYRGKGYGLAYVSLPAQTLKGGTVKLLVVEGRVGKIAIQGNDHTRSAVFEKRATGLMSGDVYTDAAAERAVLLMNDLPGVQARAVLSPGADYGSSDVLFNVEETRMSGDASVDDYGRSVIGRWRINAEANINSLTGSGDQLNAGITHSDGDRLNFGKLAYALPVGPAGGTLTTSYNRAEYHGIFTAAGAVGPGLPFSGSTENAVMSWQYPSTRSSSRSFYWNMGLNWDNSRSHEPGLNSLTTNILLLQIGTFYTRQFEDQSSLNMSWTLWTNGKHYDHGAGLNNVSRERGRTELDTSYQLPFAGDWYWVDQLNLSYSANTLTDADKFNLGGPGSVLGYQSAEERGDSGYFVSTEMERQFSWGPYWPLVWGVFLDNGKVWDKAGTVGLTGDSSRGISSGGLDLQLLPSADGLNARLQWAYPIGRRPSDGDKGGHIWFTLGMNF